MKKQLFNVLLGTALALPLVAHAQAYVGLNLGRAEQKVSADDIGSIKDNDTGFKLYGGFDFTKNLGVELGYTDFGKLKTSFNDGFDTGSVSFKTRSFYVAGTGTLPLNDQFSVFGKLGLSANRSKASATLNAESESESVSDTSVMFGIGAAYNITKNVSVVAEYENYGKAIKEEGADLKANMFSLGLRYKF